VVAPQSRHCGADVGGVGGVVVRHTRLVVEPPSDGRSLKLNPLSPMPGTEDSAPHPACVTEEDFV